MEKADIVKAVRKCLDENTETAALTSDENTLELDDIIEDKIKPGINAVKEIAPLSRLTISTHTLSTPVLPDGYLRFVGIHGAACGTIHELSENADNIAHRNLSEFAGIKHTKSNSVAIYTKNGIETFPADTSATLYYIKAAESETDIDSGIYDAVIMKIAALVCGTQMSSGGMQMMNAMCAENLGLTNKE